MIHSAFSALPPFHLLRYLPAMNILNVEIKARCADPDRIRRILESLDARYLGRDHQIDSYYLAQNGRLKLRQGTIENALIAYSRDNLSGPKKSQVVLYQTHDAAALKEVLDAALVTDVIVDKERDIYFVGHVKFHLDRVSDLGVFVEIEAIDESGQKTEIQLRHDCAYFLKKLGIDHSDLLTDSYSDMLRDKNENENENC